MGNSLITEETKRKYVLQKTVERKFDTSKISVGDVVSVVTDWEYERTQSAADCYETTRKCNWEFFKIMEVSENQLLLEGANWNVLALSPDKVPDNFLKMICRGGLADG